MKTASIRLRPDCHLSHFLAVSVSNHVIKLGLNCKILNPIPCNTVLLLKRKENEKFMNRNVKLITFSMVFASFAMMALGFIPKASSQPATGNMLIKIYTGRGAEEAALANGGIDINDWPLSKTFITTYASNPQITLNEYAELGEMEFDLNNQLWPTGPATSPRTGAKNVFFDPNGVRDIAALHFRRAIAHLSNKAKYTTTFLGGYGYVMETIMPVPALEGYTDYSTLTNSTADAGDPWSPGMGGYLYAYDRIKAGQEFYLGGFRDYDSDTKLEWRDPGVDGIYGTGDDGPIEELPNMKLWGRFDDPNRWQAGQDLYNELITAGIPAASGTGAAGLELRIVLRSTCFAAVMVNYDYNIYTGGWSLGADPDWVFDFFHSSMGQYGYASNYPGFKNHDFDPYAEAVKYAPAGSDVRFRAIQAQWVLNKYCADVWLWASKGVKGYRTGYENVVNYAGFGTDNGYSFNLMEWNPALGGTRLGPSNTIVYGFMNDVSALSVINSEWLWDWNALGLIYDTLIWRNPFNLAEEVGALASTWTTTDSYQGWTGKTVAEFTLRTGATFHDGTPVKPADIAYSILLVRSAGAGNAWNFPAVMDVDHIQIAGNVIRVFFSVQSAWAMHWAGFMPIINKDLWNQAVGPGTTSGYTGFIPDDTDGTYYPGTFTNAAAMRDYHPWEADANGNGITDLKEDGSYAWKYVSYVVGQSVALTANTNYPTTMYRKTGPATFTQMERSTFVTAAFHGIGDVNYPGGYGDAHGWYTPPRESITLNPSDTNGDWTNPTRAYSSDNQYATSDTNGATQQYSKYDTRMLASTTIISVELGIEAYSSVSDSSVNVTVSWDGGTSWAPEKSVSLPTTDPNRVTWLSFTEATTWNPIKLSDTNFRARITATFVTPGKISLDWIPLRIIFEGSASPKIDLYDLIKISISLTTISSGSWGPGPYQYNPDADLDNNGVINILDLGRAGVNFEKKMG
jgi:ABC-type transport system substrate-binding protein